MPFFFLLFVVMVSFTAALLNLMWLIWDGGESEDMWPLDKYRVELEPKAESLPERRLLR
jgi:hypothetical protein